MNHFRHLLPSLWQPGDGQLPGAGRYNCIKQLKRIEQKNRWTHVLSRDISFAFFAAECVFVLFFLSQPTPDLEWLAKRSKVMFLPFLSGRQLSHLNLRQTAKQKVVHFLSHEVLHFFFLWEELMRLQLVKVHWKRFVFILMDKKANICNMNLLLNVIAWYHWTVITTNKSEIKEAAENGK